MLLTQVVLQTVAASYSVEGAFSYELKPPDGKKVEPRFQHFDLVVDECRWKVIVTRDEKTNPADLDYHSVYQFDGTNLTHYDVFFGPHTNASGSIEASPVPKMDGSVPYPWLAFASACYFESVTNGHAISLHPAISRKGVMKRYEVPVEISLSPSLPHLPVSVRYTTDGIMSLEDDGLTLKKNPLSLFLPRTSPFKERFLSAEFKSVSFTNIDGFSFPATFEYREYGPKADAKTMDDLDCLLVVHGTATNIIVGDINISLQLPPMMKSYLTDRRFPQRGVNYTITNGIVPSTNSLEATIARKRATDISARMEVIQKERAVARRKKIIWAGLSITILVIASVVFFVRKRTINAGSQAGDKLG